MARLLADFIGEGTVDNSTQLRQEFIQIGIRQFKETPIFGIGMGSSYVLTKMYTGHSTYLHNNFVEMLASGGILGFVVFYSMHAYVLYQLWKKRHKNDPLTDVCLTLLLIYILADYGTVSYYTKETYFLFMICFLQAETNRGETNEPKKNIPGRMEVSYKA